VSEYNFLLDMVKQNGITALLFIIFFLYHRDQVASWKALREADTKREERTHELFKSQLEVQQAQLAQLARMEQKMDSNSYCPMVRKESGRG